MCVGVDGWMPFSSVMVLVFCSGVVTDGIGVRELTVVPGGIELPVRATGASEGIGFAERLLLELDCQGSRSISPSGSLFLDRCSLVGM